MKIDFENLKFKNILSYGNTITEFNFKNGIDLVMGSNGMGKSSFVDALTYCLFGKPFRKINIGKLVNNKNNKALHTETIFSINGNRFKVVRGIKPDIFEIYKEDESGFSQIEKPSTNRDYQILLEENILQFGENVFRQLIALGANLSTSRNFMELNKNEKEEVLQVITDTAIFTKIKERVKEEKTTQKTMLTEYSYKIEVQKHNLDSMKISIASLEKQNEEMNENRDSIISHLKDEEFEIMCKLDKYPVLLSALDKLHSEWLENGEKLKEMNSSLETILEKEQDIKAKVRKLIANEQNKVICPSCEFEIKEHLPYSAQAMKDELNCVLVEKTETLSVVEDTIKIQNEILQKTNNRNRIAENEKQSKISLAKIKEKFDKINEWKQIEVNYAELNLQEVEFDNTKNRFVSIKNSLSDLDELEEMVSDKNLKGVILNQQLPFLNKYINEFLELFGSKFNFVIDNEFNEKIISRNSDNDFNSLSNGQKQRITLSILFAFLKLIEEKNGISTNLLILDEYLDSSLDVSGIDEVMVIIDEVFSKSKDVVLISHNPDIKNKLELLSRIIKVKQIDGFSSFETDEI